jgi:hypothetical protein
MITDNNAVEGAEALGSRGILGMALTAGAEALASFKPTPAELESRRQELETRREQLDSASDLHDISNGTVDLSLTIEVPDEESKQHFFKLLRENFEVVKNLVAQFAQTTESQVDGNLAIKIEELEEFYATISNQIVEIKNNRDINDKDRAIETYLNATIFQNADVLSGLNLLIAEVVTGCGKYTARHTTKINNELTKVNEALNPDLVNVEQPEIISTLEREALTFHKRHELRFVHPNYNNLKRNIEDIRNIRETSEVDNLQLENLEREKALSFLNRVIFDNFRKSVSALGLEPATETEVYIKLKNRVPRLSRNFDRRPPETLKELHVGMRRDILWNHINKNDIDNIKILQLLQIYIIYCEQLVFASQFVTEFATKPIKNKHGGVIFDGGVIRNPLIAMLNQDSSVTRYNVSPNSYDNEHPVKFLTPDFVASLSVVRNALSLSIPTSTEQGYHGFGRPSGREEADKLLSNFGISTLGSGEFSFKQGQIESYSEAFRIRAGEYSSEHARDNKQPVTIEDALNVLARTQSKLAQMQEEQQKVVANVEEVKAEAQGRVKSAMESANQATGRAGEAEQKARQLEARLGELSRRHENEILAINVTLNSTNQELATANETIQRLQVVERQLAAEKAKRVEIERRLAEILAGSKKGMFGGPTVDAAKLQALIDELVE